MDLATWMNIGVIALVDAVNFPVAILLIIVLARPNPLANGLAYSLGMLGTHFLGGFVFAAGLGETISGFLTALGPNVGYIELGVALILLAMAAQMARTSDEPDSLERDKRLFAGPARSAGLATWFIAGVGITMTKLPIAVLYGTAVIDMAAKTQGAPLSFVGGLIYYHLIAYFPFFLIWAVWLIWRRSSARWLRRLNRWMQSNFNGAARAAVLLVAFALAADGIARLQGTPFFGP